MPTNAEIHAAIDLYITAQRSHILNNTVAQVFHDMVDNIAAGPGGVPGIDDVLAEGQALTANRIIDLNGNNLKIQDGGEDWLKVDPALGVSELVARNSTGLGNEAEYNATVTNESAAFSIYANFNAGSKSAYINGYADTAESIIEYVSEVHSFEGEIIITALAGGGTTGLSIDNDGKIIRTP